MAVTQILTTDTLEQMRVKLNNLTQNDFGDPALFVGSGLSSTSVMGAVLELNAQVQAAAGFSIRDSSLNTQFVGAGQTLEVIGTSNQINAVVSAPDRLTLSFPNTININTGINVSSMSISSGSITSSTGSISFNDENLLTTGTLGAGITTVSSLISSGNITGNTAVLSSFIRATELELTSGNIVFEGTTADAFETTLTVVDPTADRTITIPNRSGTIITNGDTATVTGTMISGNTITNDNIANATIRASKLNLASDTVTVNTLNATTITGTGGTSNAVTLSSDNTSAASNFVIFASGQTGGQSLKTDNEFTYNPSTNVLSTTAAQARYADLAEIYKTDKNYDIGTVVMIGGLQEVTECFVGCRALGVISEKPAFLMNAKAEGQPIALKGRVLVKVTGDIKKGDELVAGNGGYATKVSEEFKKVFAIALENNEKGLIEAVIL